MKPGLLVLAQALDAASLAVFYGLVHPTALAEQNPLVLALMAAGGIQLVILAKVGAALFAAWRSRHLAAVRVARFVMAAAVVSGSIGAGFNVAAIVLAKHAAG
jgi:hypothetical protein